LINSGNQKVQLWWRFFLTNREGAKDAKEEKRREENKAEAKISINGKVYAADWFGIVKLSSHNPQQSAMVGCLGRQHNN
jgi:hypothetical protein